MTQRAAPYGSWKSPITADMIVSESVGLSQLTLDGDDVYWVEMRPAEGGRNVVVRRTPDGRISDVTPAPFNARTRVHEYGGGAYLVDDGVVYFSNFADQRLYRQPLGGLPEPVTPAADVRYADGVVDRANGSLVCVREDHASVGEPVNAIAAVDLDGGDAGRVLVSGSDFYSSPRLSPDGARLAWIEWSHPNMPWDGTELWLAEIGKKTHGGSLVEKRRVAGGDRESILQPEWSPDGVLHFVSDCTGWWNLHRWRGGRVEPLCEMDAEFGKPPWTLGGSCYAFESAERIVCAYCRKGTWRLALLDAAAGGLEDLDAPGAELSIGDVRAAPGRAVFAAGSPAEPVSLARLDLSTSRLDVLRRSSSVAVDGGYLSRPQSVEFPTEGGLTAHAFLYPPRNRDYEGPAGERPPMLVMSHGGPTGAASTSLDLRVQYWTSRGIAVLDVNYGGSSGYGTAYRRRLDGAWGIVDVDDCVNGALYVAERGEADRGRLAIRGGSAGGYTTLAALTFRDVFEAGASYYGVSDLEALARETHKFEARYLDTLIGAYPECREAYVERSPIHHTDRLSCPIVMFQGLEDEIVPPAQAEAMLEAMRRKRLPVAYVPFEGEQHGFRRAENVKRALEGELYFYSRVFGFDLADPVEPLPIENL